MNYDGDAKRLRTPVTNAQVVKMSLTVKRAHRTRSGGGSWWWRDDGDTCGYEVETMDSFLLNSDKAA